MHKRYHDDGRPQDLKPEKTLRQWPWLYVAMGIAATIAGIILTSMNVADGADANGTDLVIGGVLTTFGPVVISFAISREIGRREARDDVADHLGSISVNLAHSVSTLSQTFRVQAESSTNRHNNMQAVHALDGIKIQIDQLQNVIGKKFDGTAMTGTLNELATMGAQITQAAKLNDVAGVARLGAGMDKVVRSLQGASQRTAQYVECPNCLRQTAALLAADPGATAFVNCSNCAFQFNTHRNGAGDVVTRPVGRAEFPKPPIRPEESVPPATNSAGGGSPDAIRSESERLAATCPSCSSSFSYRRFAGKEQTVVCFACDHSVIVDAKGDVSKGISYSREFPVVKMKDSGRYWAECPVCHQTRPCIIRIDGNLIGLCHEDRMLMALSEVAVQAFKSAS